ncbi:MAG: hypothetical protein IPP78_16080 [Holophagaceae bacterium]|nr:hypothetical protein [Holophagaceae bacterium]
MAFCDASAGAFANLVTACSDDGKDGSSIGDSATDEIFIMAAMGLDAL